MFTELKDNILYFAGGVVGANGIINDPKWLKISNENSQLLSKEYNRFVKTNETASFVVCGSAYYLMVKEEDYSVFIWKLGQLYVRQVISIKMDKSKHYGHETTDIFGHKVVLGNNVINKKDFSKHYKINIIFT